MRSWKTNCHRILSGIWYPSANIDCAGNLSGSLWYQVEGSDNGSFCFMLEKIIKHSEGMCVCWEKLDASLHLGWMISGRLQRNFWPDLFLLLSSEENTFDIKTVTALSFPETDRFLQLRRGLLIWNFSLCHAVDDFAGYRCHCCAFFFFLLPPLLVLDFGASKNVKISLHAHSRFEDLCKRQNGSGTRLVWKRWGEIKSCLGNKAAYCALSGGT